jgi:hypothetical protein
MNTPINLPLTTPALLFPAISLLSTTAGAR